MVMTKAERTELEVARIRVKEYQERIDALFGDKPTDTFYNDWITTGQPIRFKDYPLPPGALIKFRVGTHGEHIQARIRTGVVEIMGDSAIIISPRAANTIEIRIKE